MFLVFVKTDKTSPLSPQKFDNFLTFSLTFLYKSAKINPSKGFLYNRNPQNQKVSNLLTDNCGVYHRGIGDL